MKVWRLPGIHHDSGCVVLSGTETSLIVDPGTSWYQLLVQERVEGRLEGHAPVERILLTHRHFDHSGAAAFLAEQWSVPVLAHEDAIGPLSSGELFTTWASRFDSDMPVTACEQIAAGDLVDLGETSLETIGLPGHTSCSLGWWIGDRGMLVAGDTLPKAGHPARWDHPSGQLPALVDSVGRIIDLEPEVVLCGHGDTLRGRKRIATELARHHRFLTERVEAGGGRPEEWARPVVTASHLTPRPAWPAAT